jgi:hypothetical protein
VTPCEVLFWRRLAADLGIEVVTPFEMRLPNGARLQVSALVRNFGPKLGMVVDAKFGIIRPHTKELRELGYGFSSNIGHSPNLYRREDMIEVLADWGWSGAAEQKPGWLP